MQNMLQCGLDKTQLNSFDSTASIRYNVSLVYHSLPFHCINKTMHYQSYLLGSHGAVLS